MQTVDGDLDTTTQVVDLYREVHKGLRSALFQLTVAAGALDAEDSDAVDAFRRRFADVDMMLTTHHGHEDGARLLGLIAEHAPDSVDVVEAAHEQSEAALAILRPMVAALDASSAGDVYDAAAQFTAAYLAHMDVEEHRVMPALQQNVDGDTLFAIMMEIRGSVPPPEMCVFLSYMLPAMDIDERTSTLGGMKAGAPPEVFDMFWDTAQSCLVSADFARVAGRIGM